MQWKSYSKTIVVLSALAMALALAPGAWAGAKKEVLYSFKGGKDGKYPTYSPLVFDKANLYGTTFFGGKYGLGTVFELKPNKNGTWSETVIHAFAGDRDGAQPYSGLVSDAAGNLYGTTGLGGGLGKCFNGTSHYCGTVYRLSRGRNGTWSETILRRFDDRASGGYLYNALILDASGNLYGAAAEGGDGADGVAFELIRGETVPWKEKVLYSFHGPDGNTPDSPLMFDANGNLYGTTIGGGPVNGGVVFELQPTKRGPWRETILHAFTQVPQGYEPSGLLAMDKEGNLYGSTQDGGKYSCGGPGCGVIYELRHENGSWKETIIHEFNGHDFKGIVDDTEGVAFDASGNLYGTASGLSHYPGGIFRLVHQGGAWAEQLIYKFPLDALPGMVTYGSDGRLYGALVLEGKYNLGQVYRIVP